MRPMLEEPQLSTASPCSDTGDDLARRPRAIRPAASRAAVRADQDRGAELRVARLKRWRFGQSSESLDAQSPLFDAIVADTAIEDAAARQEQQQAPKDRASGRRPVRQALPAALPRIEHHHELTDTTCVCGQPLKRIGEDVSEKLDCVPGVVLVHRHIRGK